MHNILSHDNKAVNGLWICEKGGMLSDMERLCIHSFCANGHDFYLWTYDEIANVPQDTAPGRVILCDGNEILPYHEVFKGKYKSLAPFADYFRWKLLAERGGWWVDMDMVCLRPFDFPDAAVFAWESRVKIQIAVLKLPAGHVLATDMLKECQQPLRVTPYDTAQKIRRKIRYRLLFWKNPNTFIGWDMAGGLSSFFLATKYYNLIHCVKPATVFYPITYTMMLPMCNEEWHDLRLLEPILKNVYGIHWYSGMWSLHGWDKNGTYPQNSPYQILKDRYLPEFAKKKIGYE